MFFKYTELTGICDKTFRQIWLGLLPSNVLFSCLSLRINLYRTLSKFGGLISKAAYKRWEKLVKSLTVENEYKSCISASLKFICSFHFYIHAFNLLSAWSNILLKSILSKLILFGLFELLKALLILVRFFTLLYHDFNIEFPCSSFKYKLLFLD